MEFAGDRWVVIAVAVASVSVVAIFGGLLTEVGDWYESLTFPPYRPPNWLFGPAWTAIFALIATSGVMAWEAAPDDSTRRTLIVLFAINGALNLLWTPLFFKFHRPDWAFYEVFFFWASVLALVIYIAGFSPKAAWVISPYLVWVSFAGFLNWRIVELNKPFGAGG